MTKEQITEKANLYKFKLNDCKTHIDQCQSSINTCNKFRKYFSNKTPEKQKLSKIFLTSGALFLPTSILCLFTAPFLGIPLFIISVCCIERFFFFRQVTKKFKHCQSFFTKVATSLTEKQTDFVNQKEYALSQICKLENEIPEDVIETITMIKEKELSQLNSSIIKKCIERTNSTEETYNL